MLIILLPIWIILLAIPEVPPDPQIVDDEVLYVQQAMRIGLDGSLDC